MIVRSDVFVAKLDDDSGGCSNPNQLSVDMECNGFVQSMIDLTTSPLAPPYVADSGSDFSDAAGYALFENQSETAEISISYTNLSSSATCYLKLGPKPFGIAKVTDIDLSLDINLQATENCVIKITSWGVKT